MTQPHSFEDLVVRYQNVVCAVAYAVLRDRARSEEVAQEAFLVAWQKLPALAAPPAMPGWICGIARNLAANAARRKQEAPMTDTTRELIAEGTPLDTMLDKESDALARQALASLRETDREAVVLYYRAGSIAEVAGTLGITETAARQRLHRGRERLKAALGAVETTLRATRPGPAFTAACVAALAVRGGSAEAATTGTAALAGRARAIAPVVALLGLGGVIAIAQATSLAQPLDPPATVTPTTTVGTLPQAKPAAVFRTLGERDKAAVAERITRARIARTAAAPVGAIEDKVRVFDFAGGALADVQPAVPPKDMTILNKATLRYAIRSIQPLLLECHEAASPRQGGTIEVKIRLVSEPGVATIVETAELGGDPHLTGDAELAECLRETLLSIELPPMAEAGKTDVIYPFTVTGGSR